ncbi:MAG: hypothetical protein ACK5W9_11630 [Bdellovibrionales bacterium]
MVQLSCAFSFAAKIRVTGEAGPSQLLRQVKAVHCDSTTKVCKKIYYFNLNQAESVIPGRYILGFENSIYPGFVDVKEGQTAEVSLFKVSVPSQLTNQDQVRVFRDLDAEIEKNKIYFTQHHLGRPLFRLGQWNFGDLYLKKPGQMDITARLNYDVCNRSRYSDPEVEEAKLICQAATQALKSGDWRNMSPLFQFSGKDHMERELQKGQYIQNLVSEAGDRRQIVMRRMLVSAIIKGRDFVSVFPGRYRFLSDAPRSSSISVSVGPQTQNFD